MWIYALVFVVSLAIAVSVFPKTQTQPPAGLSEYQVPTAEDGREIAVLFGTKDIKSPNIVWYGDFNSIPVKKKGGKK